MLAELLGLAEDAASNVTDLRLGAASKVLLGLAKAAIELYARRLGAKSSDNVPEASEADEVSGGLRVLALLERQQQ